MKTLSFRSFRVRLMLGAVVWIFIWSMIGGYALSEHFRSLVTHQFEDELSGHAEELMGIIDVDASGTLSLKSPMTDPLFQGDRGYYWQVTSDDGQTLRSASLKESLMRLDGEAREIDQAIMTTGIGPGGKATIYVLPFKLADFDQPLWIAVGADTQNLDEVVKRYNKGLGLWLMIVAFGLIASSIAQVTYGLLPLSRVRKALADIRSGQSDRLPDNLPPEVSPLASEMNSLIEANLGIVRRARVQAGNLGHSLKTPLALLMDIGVKLDAKGDSVNGRLIIEQCERMTRQISHQMAQARASASRSSAGLATGIRPSLETIVSGISRVYTDKHLIFEADGALDARVVCDSRDLDDMLGNVIDNAAKWAKSTVHILVEERAATGMVQIRVEDDGPGLPLEARLKVFDIGERLDEQKPGSGLGLAIVKDFADLYGGGVWIETGTLGGAVVILELPEIKVPS